MSHEQFLKVVDLLPGEDRGVYFHNIRRFVNGKVTTRKRTVKMTIELSLDELGARPDADLRDVFLPHAAGNTLVPMIVFVDPKMFLETQPLADRPAAHGLGIIEGSQP